MRKYGVTLPLSEEEYETIVKYFDEHPELKIGVTLGRIVMDHLEKIVTSSDNQWDASTGG